MVYISATEAARRLGVSEKTIRRWIQEKRLAAFHPHGYKNRLAIAEQDVEQKKRELAEFEQPGPGPAEQKPAASKDIIERLEKVEHWLSDIQRWHSELEKRLEALEQGVSIAAAHQDGEASPRPLQKQGRTSGSVTTIEPPAELPSGSMLLKDFAEKYHVNRRTFEDHVKKGLKGEYVQTTVLPNPVRSDEVKRYLTPEQQASAVSFWQRHNVPFTLPQEQDQEKATR